jgi:tetratricopeptide (TPR) repeat protein
LTVFSQSRRFFTIFALLFASIASAETIYLKNGLYIVVRKVEERDGQIAYWVAGTRYTIPKSAVLKIEQGDGPAPQPITGTTSVQDIAHREAPIARGNQEKIQLPLLSEIERDGDGRTTTNAYFLAGVIEAQHGDMADATTYFERAVSLRPTDPVLLQWQAIALSSLGRYRDAISVLTRAAELKSDSAQIFQFLGLAQYDAGYTSDAVTSWETALKLSPDAMTQRLLHKAERELEIEQRSRQRQSSHFTLQYEGDKTSPELQKALLQTLENQFRDLSREFGYEPGESIIVILYTQKDFFDITDAPSWAGGQNDGKLRIPIRGASDRMSELDRVLKHELTHSFVRGLAGPRCPLWLNEGLAQMTEPRTSAPYARILGPLFEQHKQIPLSVLEGSFTRFSDIQAQVAYAESLSAVEYLRERFGMNDVLEILRSIGSGSSPEDALHHGTGMDYPTLESKIGAYLAGSMAQ